ncbi:MAG TPA: SMI1/KNR4 family protein [Actinocrinis sp.]
MDSRRSLERTVADQAYEDDLIRRVAAKAVVDEPRRGNPLRPPVLSADCDRVEQLLGFCLHPLLRRLYTEVGNGGWGPGYGLLPLFGSPGRAVVSEGITRPQRVVELAPDECRAWPLDVVAISNWGCAMSAAVDCRTVGGTVLLHEPNADPPDPADTRFVDAESLADWLETWLAGTGWYRELGPDEEPPEFGMRPWAQATARLS